MLLAFCSSSVDHNSSISSQTSEGKSNVVIWNDLESEIKSWCLPIEQIFLTVRSSWSFWVAFFSTPRTTTLSPRTATAVAPFSTASWAYSTYSELFSDFFIISFENHYWNLCLKKMSIRGENSNSSIVCWHSTKRTKLSQRTSCFKLTTEKEWLRSFLYWIQI